jgi:hypothetical protein
MPSKAAPPTKPGVAGPVALLVFHGMGQQVRYATLEETVGLLERAAKRHGGRVALKSRKHLPNGERFVPLAELIVEADSRRVEVHVFEAYWAPLAEGRISTWETFTFLVRSAVEGVLNGRRFTRYLFSPEEPPQGETKTVPRTTVLGLVLAAATMGALWVFELVFLAIVLAGVFAAGEPRWLPRLLPGLIPDYAAALSILLASGLLCVGVPAALRPLGRRTGWTGALRAISRMADLGLKAAAVTLCAFAIHVAFACLGTAVPELGIWVLHPSAVGENLLRTAWGEFLHPLRDSRTFLLALGGSFWLASSLLRAFLREYVGDVAIYLSGHKVNRFYEARKEIQETALQAAHFVYDRQRADKSGLIYERVVLLGHSLGSVIAYDTLNRLFLEDDAGAGRSARTRTGALVTYGSPLDKVAFVFRAQRGRDGSFREAMVASLQPLIQDRNARRFPWVNVHSPFDWIGGDIDFYDPAPERLGPQPPYRVANMRDDSALTPIAAHREHAEGPVLQALALDAVLGRLEEHDAVRASAGGGIDESGAEDLRAAS